MLKKKSINTEIIKLKSSLQFMDDTVNKLKEDMNQHVEVGMYETFKQEVMDKLDDMENCDKRNNIVFWNIPEKSEAGTGCRNLIYNILHYQLGQENPRGFVMERVHGTQTETVLLPGQFIVVF